MNSRAWTRRLRRDAKKKREAGRARKREIKLAAATLAKVLPHFTSRWNLERGKTLRRALDVLAGEGLAS